MWRTFNLTLVWPVLVGGLAGVPLGTLLIATPIRRVSSSPSACFCRCFPSRSSSSAQVIWLALIAFPGTILGAWLGARVYRALSDSNFRDFVPGLLFLSGVGSGAVSAFKQVIAWPPCGTRARAVPSQAKQILVSR